MRWGILKISRFARNDNNKSGRQDFWRRRFDSSDESFPAPPNKKGADSLFALRPRYRQAPVSGRKQRAAPRWARLCQHRSGNWKLAVFGQNDNYVNAELYFRFFKLLFHNLMIHIQVLNNLYIIQVCPPCQAESEKSGFFFAGACHFKQSGKSEILRFAQSVGWEWNAHPTLQGHFSVL